MILFSTNSKLCEEKHAHSPKGKTEKNMKKSIHEITKDKLKADCGSIYRVEQ